MQQHPLHPLPQQQVFFQTKIFFFLYTAVLLMLRLLICVLNVDFAATVPASVPPPPANTGRIAIFYMEQSMNMREEGILPAQAGMMEKWHSKLAEVRGGKKIPRSRLPVINNCRMTMKALHRTYIVNLIRY
jgi:hypothetical protein